MRQRLDISSEALTGRGIIDQVAHDSLVRGYENYRRSIVGHYAATAAVGTERLASHAEAGLNAEFIKDVTGLLPEFEWQNGARTLEVPRGREDVVTNVIASTFWSSDLDSKTHYRTEPYYVVGSNSRYMILGSNSFSSPSLHIARYASPRAFWRVRSIGQKINGRLLEATVPLIDADTMNNTLLNTQTGSYSLHHKTMQEVPQAVVAPCNVLQMVREEGISRGLMDNFRVLDRTALLAGRFGKLADYDELFQKLLADISAIRAAKQRPLPYRRPKPGQ